MSDSTRKVFNMVLAVLVSIGAWVFVVYNYDPMTTVKYSEVPVTYTGLDNLADRGYTVSEANYDSVEVTLKQRRTETGKITSDDITVTADVSGLASGENTVTLDVSGPDGTSVSDVSLKAVTVDIESSTSVEMEISVEYPAGTDETAEPIITELSETTATVISTEERLAEIDRVAAVIDPDDLGKKAKPITSELVALDADGNEVINVVIYPETVSFRASAAIRKKVKLEVNVDDESDDSYERTYTAPDTVVIKGYGSAIEDIDSVKAVRKDISYLYEDTEIELEYELPEGVFVANESLGQVMKVTVAEKTDDDSSDSDTDSTDS